MSVHALHPQPALEQLLGAAVAEALTPMLTDLVERLVGEERNRRITWKAGEAAALLGVSENHVRNLCDTGVLPSVRLGHVRVIPDDALRARIAELARTT